MTSIEAVIRIQDCEFATGKRWLVANAALISLVGAEDRPSGGLNYPVWVQYGSSMGPVWGSMGRNPGVCTQEGTRLINWRVLLVSSSGSSGRKPVDNPDFPSRPCEIGLFEVRYR